MLILLVRIWEGTRDVDLPPGAHDGMLLIRRLLNTNLPVRRVGPLHRRLYLLPALKLVLLLCALVLGSFLTPFIQTLGMELLFAFSKWVVQL